MSDTKPEPTLKPWERCAKCDTALQVMFVYMGVVYLSCPQCGQESRVEVKEINHV